MKNGSRLVLGAIPLSVLALISALMLFGCSGEYDPTRAPETIETERSLTDVISVDIEEPYPADMTLKVVACGDNIMYTGTIRDAKSVASGSDRDYDFSKIYENIKPIISDADIAFVNQETPMSDLSAYGSYPHFNSPRELADDLIDAGFNVINIATNHMLDAGSAGLKSTIEFWNTKPVTLIGGYLDEDDFDKIRVVEKNEAKIAFLSFTYSTNGYKLSSEYDIVIPYIDRELIEKQVKEAKEIADLVFVSMHWGTEYSFKTNSEQRELAALMAELGVDVIIGHHPHVLQPIEWIDGTDGHRTLCIYSLGNLAAEQANDYNLVGGIMTFEIVRKKGEYSIESPLFLPTVYYYSKSFYQNSVHLMENFTSDMAKSVGLSYYGNSTTVERLRKYVTDTISPEFLPDYLK